MPQRMLQLLDELDALGFNNDDYRLIHHWGEKARISSMVSHCNKLIESGGSFRGSHNNECVKRRLEYVLRAYQEGDLSRPAKPGVFRALCLDAKRVIPR